MYESSPSQTDAHRFFREIVEPTVGEFMVDPSDKRRGCLACLVLASLTEHYTLTFAGASKKEREDMKLAFYNENKAVQWVADVANATRHVKRDPKFKKIGFSDIQTMNMGQCDVLRCGWPIDGEEVLVGSEHEWRLADLLEWAMDFWRQKLASA